MKSGNSLPVNKLLTVDDLPDEIRKNFADDIMNDYMRFEISPNGDINIRFVTPKYYVSLFVTSKEQIKYNLPDIPRTPRPMLWWRRYPEIWKILTRIFGNSIMKLIPEDSDVWVHIFPKPHWRYTCYDMENCSEDNLPKRIRIIKRLPKDMLGTINRTER